MTWLTGFLALISLNYNITLGTYSGGFVQYQPLAYVDIGNPLFVNFGGDVQIGPVFMGGAIRTDFNMVSITNYSPFQNTYTFNAGLRFGPVEVGYTHTCYHPSDPYYMQYILSNIAIPIPASEGAVDVFYVMVKGRIGK